MTRKWLFMFTMFVIVNVAIFVSSQMTQAQRPDRSELRNREGGDRRRGNAVRFSPTNLIDSSWADLSFGVKVEDETLLKARLIYQKHRDRLEKSAEEARQSGDFQSIRNAIMEIRESLTKERNAILTRKQAKAIEVIERERMQQMMRRSSGSGNGRRGNSSGRSR